MNNEPVAWMVNGKAYADIFEAEHHSKFTNKPMIPLYTHPPAQQWTIDVKAKTLTYEEILELTKDSTIFEYREFDDDMVRFARAILRKANEK